MSHSVTVTPTPNQLRVCDLIELLRELPPDAPLWWATGETAQPGTSRPLEVLSMWDRPDGSITLSDSEE